MAQTMSVQIQDGKLRSDPNFLGKITTSVAYGDMVTIVRQQESWYLVTTRSGQTGWIHSSALTEKAIVLKAGDANVDKTASQREIALAGKGFNADVEKEYKSRNPQLNFEWVDRMERYVVSDENIRQFVLDGKLTPEGGNL
jgi:uncharacterized protein YgiM (DUF1202 family)